MNGVKINIKTGGDFDAIPADLYTVLITDVNLVMQQKFQSTEEEEVLNFEMTILDNKFMPPKEGDKGDVPIMKRKLWKRCRPALNEKSWLGKLVKAAYGRDLTEDEKNSFDPESIIGKQVNVLVEQKESKDGTKMFNNILSFAKCAKALDTWDIVPKSQEAVVEKSSVPVTAPAEDEDPDLADLKKQIDEAGAKKK